MYMGEGDAKFHKVLITVHDGEGAGEGSTTITTNYTMKFKVINRKEEKKSLYGTTGHASFRPFGGIDDDLTDPFSMFVSCGALADHGRWYILLVRR